MSKQKQVLMHYSHLGIQFALTIGLFTFLGYWLERRYGFVPWGIVAGVFLGFPVALYNLLKSAQDLEKDLSDSENREN